MLDMDIKIDLHIHTKASDYKEEPGLVDKSTFENIDVFLEKLDNEKHQISMFSFTDHNRFDPEIYKKTRVKIKEGNYKYVKTLLAGVEFDVLLEEGKEPCHIITIFNDKSNKDLEKIKEEIDKVLLKGKEDYYTKKQFEDLIRNIGLETILIVCQRKSLERKDGGHRSLSDSTNTPFEYLKYGYFDALEFQKPGVEGILLNNLSPLEIDVALVLGSDCHDWSVYPRHNRFSPEKDFSFTNIRCLPTFKGLLLALTSPKTRFRRKKKVSKAIEYLMINDEKHELSAGLNAIIGENGSGKTLLLNALKEKPLKYYRNLIKENKIRYDKYADLGRTLIVEQGEITQNNYDHNSIFGKDINYFREIDYSEFDEKINNYSSSLFKKIESNIEENELFLKLENNKFTYDSKLEKGTTFYIMIHKIDRFEAVPNPHEDRAKKIKAIINALENELKLGYYTSEEKEKLETALKKIKLVYFNINERNKRLKKEIDIKNLIRNRIDAYQSKIERKTTSESQLIADYKEEKNKVKFAIINYVKQKVENSKLKVGAFPDNIYGKSENKLKGFNFSRIAAYHEKDLEQLFFKKIFKKKYQSLEKVLEIKTYEELIEAISGVTEKEQINSGWLNNLEKFKQEAKKYQEKIFELSNGSEIGNTLGEKSLVYYKFKLHNYGEWDLMVIDQPEDNISTPRMKNELIPLFDNIRDKKQVIFVTHNPLLVVNLDVDNVIYVEMQGDIIKAVSGCLENEEKKILDIVAEKMDGGLETIEKRLKYYGKRS